jgi:hypothetical protein
MYRAKAWRFSSKPMALTLLLALICLISYLLIHRPNPYSDWRTYCDSAGHLCFKYPDNWRLANQDTQSQAVIDIHNASHSIDVDYLNPAFDDAMATMGSSLYAAYVKNISAKASLAVVGVVTHSAPYEPFYAVVDRSSLKTLGIQQSKTTLGDNDLNHYTFANGDNEVSLQANPTKAFSSFKTAKAWFTSTDGQTALLILRSLYIN